MKKYKIVTNKVVIIRGANNIINAISLCMKLNNVNVDDIIEISEIKE